MTSRRDIIKAGLAAGAAAAMPAVVRAQPAAPSAARTVRMVKAYQLVSYDPVFTTSNSTQDHAYAIYDTLFGLDSKGVPQMQMVGNWDVSSDKKTYTFELRDGLGWHDGARVTAADCVASIRRWAQNNPSGQLLLERARDISKKDEKTFTIALKEPLGLVLDILASESGAPLFMMREKDASLPPNEQVKAYIGSGPFKFNEALARPGQSFTYDRNPNYVARKEAADFSAGGKAVKVDRVVWDSMPDLQTAVSALTAGEIDYLQNPPIDLFPVIEGNPDLTLELENTAGFIWFIRVNCLQKPFDNVKVRQALLHLVNQEAYMQAAIGNPKYSRANILSMFGSGSIYTNNENTGWYKKDGDPEAAKRLLKEAGYAGEKVVILQSTDNKQSSNCVELTAQLLRGIGMNVELAPGDRSAMVKRRALKTPVAEGGWSMIMGPWGAGSFDDLVGNDLTLMNGDKAWIGWPKDDKYEALRAQWPDAKSVEERKALARKLQQAWWDHAGTPYLGESVQPVARRKSLTGLLAGRSEYVKMWNLQKA
ncbi:peptide/nickel transport system substrate-binding protein [Bradyrhizobium sp. Rc2d]|uniref:ABC transporter substrate-binding protein n=1 Tax=Bradyrhizobium sp. Rc2d TaxID=1855321 RepID=UPI00087E7E1C|nr:ABC transporter substrate-binding protein [Bradyrhizobium sp. Rc2d]SDJ98984.1 peptide/nickel transport system substrate-binding protein [Bradyrhizobium sp. Rc2d]